MQKTGKDIALEGAERILADVKPKECFWTNNGTIIRNLHELLNAIEHMDDTVFNYHVHDNRNDFANWVRDVLNDDWLAGKISGTKSKAKAAKKIQDRIRFAEKIIDNEKITKINESSETFNGIRQKIKLIKDAGIFILGILIGTVIGIVIAAEFNLV